MNERIRELVKQAGGHFSTHTLTSYPAQHRESIQLWDKNIEKFAELIVRECMDVARQQRNPANLNYKPSERFVEDLRQHFGVKE